MGHRALRLGASAVVLAAAAMTLTPHVVSYVSSSAVVNAPVISVRSPFDGVIARASADLSAPVSPGQLLLELAADRADRTVLAELTSRRDMAIGELAGLEAQRTRLLDLHRGLTVRRDSYIAEVSDWLQARGDEAAARAEVALTRLAQMSDERDRRRRLAARGALSEVALTDSEAEADVAGHSVRLEAARVQSLLVARRALGNGVALDGMADGLGQLVQRLDDIDLRLAEIDQRHTALTAARAALDAQVAVLAERNARHEAFAPRATAPGVIWKASPPTDMPVLVGDEMLRVLDCSRRFIEVAISERHFEKIRPGDAASVRLKGGSGWFQAEVEAVRGAGGRFDRPALAAVVPNIDESQLSVLVRLPTADVTDPDVAHGFCDVGRTADVRFGRPDGLFGPHLRQAGAAAMTHLAALADRLTGAEAGRVGPGGDGPGDE
jgi:multidrug resistance efflux pump